MKRSRYPLPTLATLIACALFSLCFIESAESVEPTVEPTVEPAVEPTVRFDQTMPYGLDTSIYFSIISFKWEEFDEAGRELVKETGPVFGVGVQSKAVLEGVLTVQVKGELFGGSVEYDGEDQTGVPFMSDTHYTGFMGEVDVGYIMIATPTSILEPFASLGLKWWERDIEGDTVTSGAFERWSTFYARLGVRGDHAYGEDFRLFAETGVKYPFMARNKADLSAFGTTDATLKPGNEASFFAELGVKRRTLMASVYYEGMRFSRSADEFVPGRRVWQPKSEAGLLGLRLGVVF